MMTPRDQMSQDRSYFFDPNTSGAEKEGFKKHSKKLPQYLGKVQNERVLTNIVGCVLSLIHI